MEDRGRALLEIGGVALTVVLYFLCYEVWDVRGAFIAGAVVAWAGYLAARSVRDPRAPAEYGFARRGLRGASVATGWTVLAGASLCLAIGLARGTLRVDRGLGLALLLYPLWGAVQQLLVQGMVVRHLATRLPGAVVALLGGALFGAVHLPDAALAVATACLGVVFTAIYLRWRNLWPLGLAHGVLGALFYVWVLARDPWSEVVGGL